MKVTKWPAVLLCGIAMVLPLAAQEEPAPKEPAPQPEAQAEQETPPPPPPPAPKKGVEEPALHRWGGWTISAAYWSPSLVSADEELALTVNNDTSVPLIQGSDSQSQETIEAVYHLPRDVGSIAGRYDAIGTDDNSRYFSPGNFVFLESRLYPLSVGVFDDGTADGLAAHAVRRTREVRLEFQKQAFDTKWARATWGAGLRSLSHSRTLSITYYAIVPNFPPAYNINNIIRLIPIPDQFGQTSNYSGKGFGATFDVEFPLHPRFSIISGISIALYRGKAESEFSSQTSYYFNGTPDVPLTTEEFFELLQTPPDPLLGDPVDSIDQQIVQVRLATLSDTLMAQSYDVYVGFEVSVWKGLKVFGTVRDVYYANVGEYAIPTIGFMSDRKTLNAGYEGYNLGLSWRF